jgi:hypothetical protein
MNLWLDDVRPPWRFGYIGWEWAKTYDEAIALLATGKVERASLDHDLSEPATLGLHCACSACGEHFAEPTKRFSEARQVEELVCPNCGSYSVAREKTGYEVVCWLEEHPQFWPPKGVVVHSKNEVGAAKMRVVIARHYH